MPVDTRRGEQFRPDYLAVNPNAKVPAIVDGDATVFDSNAILLYLAEKTGKFLPESTPAARGEMLSWLMFVATGIGPFSGQAVHFKHFAPEKVPYALTRYLFEAERHYGILDRRLAERRYILGPSYTIVDMAAWGWARMVPFIMGDDAWGRFPNLRRLHDEIAAPARRRPGRRAAREARLQGRDGRRGPPQHVPAPRGGGRPRRLTALAAGFKRRRPRRPRRGPGCRERLRSSRRRRARRRPARGAARARGSARQAASVMRSVRPSAVSMACSRSVAMLTLLMPPPGRRTAAWIISAGTPEPPCRTRWTGVRARIASSRARSTRGLRVV